MAPELRERKRKASVSAAEATVKKVKKASADPEGAKKNTEGTKKNTEASKKRKASAEIPAKSAKKSKAEVVAEPSEPILETKSKSTTDKKQKLTDKAAKKSIPKEPTPEENMEEALENETFENSEDGEEVDDQTAALLAGFDSEEEDPEPKGKGFEIGTDVGKISKKARKEALAAQKAAASEEPGTVYLGHLPHGFYEHEIKSYFTQFGEITRYRVSRNPKTGRSKHYAFVEFKSTEVADIVARTMDNYLLFGHILKCKLLAPGQAHPALWKGANKRFKTVPWNKMEGRKLNQGMDEAGWEKKKEREEARRVKKAEEMKAMGYEFEAPALKSAKDVPKTPRELPAVATEDDANAIEIPVERRKDLVSRAIETVRSEVLEAVEIPKVESTKEKKQPTKVEKIVTVEEVTVEEPVIAEVPTTAPVSAKSKKSKASKVVEETMEETVIDTEVKAKPTTTLKSKKSSEKVTAEVVAPKAKEVKPALKSKKSKEFVAETAPVSAPKAKEVKPALKSKKSKEVITEASPVSGPKAKEIKPSLKRKKSVDTVAEAAPAVKAKKVKKQKSSSSLA